MSSNLIHGDHRDSISSKEQKKIATDMFNQMRHLKEQNEAIGYHGFSGYLERHNSHTMKNIAAISDNEEEHDTDNENEHDPDKEQKHIKSENDHLLNRLYYKLRPALRIFAADANAKGPSSSLLSVISDEENDNRDSGKFRTNL